MTLAEQRTAIATALETVDGLPVYATPITDPIPPCIAISNPNLTMSPKTRGGVVTAEWNLQLTLSRLSKSGTAAEGDKYISEVLAALTGGAGCQFVPVSARYFEPSEQTGFTLPTYVITGTTALTTC